MKYKSIPGAVLGIIGAVFALIGGLNLAMCAEIAAGVTKGAVNYTWAAYVFGIGGAVIAMIGAIMDFKNVKVGGFLMIVAVALIVVGCVLLYWSWLMIIALVLLGIGAILSFVVKKEID